MADIGMVLEEPIGKVLVIDYLPNKLFAALFKL